MLYSSSHCFWAWIIKRIRIVIYGSNNFLLFFIFSKNNPKNKQMSIGKKKFNMDPKKVYTDRKKLWNKNEMTLLHAGFPTKFLSQTPPSPFSPSTLTIILSWSVLSVWLQRPSVRLCLHLQFMLRLVRIMILCQSPCK